MNYTVEIDYEKTLVDNRNRDFVRHVEQKYKIRVSEIQILTDVSNPRIWLCKPQDDEMDISYYRNNSVIEFFTHEILHSYLICLGFVDSKFLTKDYNLNDPVVEYIFRNHVLVSKINNLFAHEKMFPLFKERNFDETLFTMDYLDVPNFQRQIIEDEFEQKYYQNISITQFIYSFFQAKDIRNPVFVELAEDHLLYLRTKDSELFMILDGTWTSWITTDDFSQNASIMKTMVDRVISWHKLHASK